MVSTLMTATVDLTGPANTALLGASSVDAGQRSVGAVQVRDTRRDASWAADIDGTVLFLTEGRADHDVLHLSTEPSHIRDYSREIPV